MSTGPTVKDAIEALVRAGLPRRETQFVRNLADGVSGVEWRDTLPLRMPSERVRRRATRPKAPEGLPT